LNLAKRIFLVFIAVALFYPQAYALTPDLSSRDGAISATFVELDQPKIERKPEPYRSGLKRIISAEPGPGDEMPRQIDFYTRYLPSHGVKAQSGKVGIITSEYEYSSDFLCFEKLPIQLSFGNQYVGIENSTAVSLPAHLTSFETDIETTLPLFGIRDTYLRLGVHPAFYTDNWSAYASSFRIPSRFFAIFIPNDKLTLVGGVAVFPDYETVVQPIVGFVYKPTDRLTFDITPRRPNIAYGINKKLSVFAEYGFDSDEFEVTKDGYQRTVLIYSEKRVGAGLRFIANKYINGSISVGNVLSSLLQYRDSLGKVQAKNGFYTELRVGAAF
jgi:hypothetical protein